MENRPAAGTGRAPREVPGPFRASGRARRPLLGEQGASPASAGRGQPSMRRMTLIGPIELMSAIFTGTPSVEAWTARTLSTAIATWDWLE
ncbi:hypothetical protein SAMN05216188_1406 [Lentzea xinjiangensis]|uniref:Uncharacterized protein n=1 Tax=Lentzea xinjiangensis TaxID=402600 RepID=A0A1H9WRP2_9PSEU|nr:hypothetical protein SAMN05216188_1406 [Lentzea xinjiangensis]